MKTRNSIREIAQWMDNLSPVNSLRSLANQHRGIISNNNFSVRDIVDRHNGGTDSKDISFLFYNTLLIDGVIGIGSAPWLSIRADLIGKEIRNSGYDIAALCEVFEEKYQKLIKKQRFSHEAMGPVWTIGNVSSGLYTLSKFPLKDQRRRFVEKGTVPDSLSNKGILLTTIDLGIGKIDVFSTHLFFGISDPPMPPLPGNVEQQVSQLILLQRTNIQIAQLKELTKFIKENHNPKHVVIVAGDMNINPSRSQENGQAYEKMKTLFSSITLKNGEKISLEDLWKIKGGKKGGTNTPTKGCALDKRDKDSTSGIIYCSDNTVDTSNYDEGRIDYIFVQKPTESHDIIIDFSRMKRRPFPFPALKFEEIKHLMTDLRFKRIFATYKNDPEKIASIISEIIKNTCDGHLSDHLGLDVKLMVNKK
jgi:endonuclease/exonuclease/phosphatase family metal-dependent hydrolase